MRARRQRSQADGATPPALERTLGLWQLTVSGVGIVIGAGIYVLIGSATAEAGSLVWLSFVLAAVLGGLTGLSYVELAGMFPSAGAEYEFARRAFSEFWGFLAGWLMIAGNIIAAGAVSLGFAEYLRHFVDLDTRVAAVGLIAALTLVIISGVRRSIWLTAVLVVLQVGGLVLVIVVGAPHVGDRSLVDGTATGVLSAAALVFFAFIGFDEVVTLSDETRNPSRDVPRALVLALALSTALYVAVGVVAVSVIDWHVLGESDRPLAMVLGHDGSTRASDIVAWIALASTTNTTLLVLTAASRLMYDMAKKGAMPPFLGALSPRTHAPHVAAVTAFGVAAGFACLGSLDLVAAVTDFAVYAVFIAVNLAVLRLRHTRPDIPRPMGAGPSIGRWPVASVLGLLATLAMMAFLDMTAWIVGAGLIGLAVLAWMVRGKREPLG